MKATPVYSRAMTSKPTRFRFYVLGVVFLVYMLATADRANIGIALPYIQAEFNLSNAQAGAVVSLFFLAYGLGQIPAAFIIKRFGVRNVMTLSILLTSVATALHAIVGSLVALKFSRVLLGTAEAPIGNGCMTTINNWFPNREKGTATGIFMAAAKAGPVLVPPIGAAIILAASWHWIFFLFALPGLLIPFLWWRLVPDDPARSPAVSACEAEMIAEQTVVQQGAAPAATGDFPLLDRLIRARPVTLIETSAGAFRSYNIWGPSLSYFLLVGTMNVILAWLPKYLAEVRGFSIMGVGLMAALPFAGAVLGNLAGGWTSDRLLGQRRKPLMMASCLATLIMMYALASAPQSKVILAILLFSTGFLLSVGFSLYPIFASRFTTRSVFPVATSILNTCGQLGGATLPLLTGFILDSSGWTNVFMLLSVSGLVAFLLLILVHEPANR